MDRQGAPRSLAEERPGPLRGGLDLRVGRVGFVGRCQVARHTLASLDAYTGESSHGATKSIYAHDPDGNEFEVMWMLPREAWGEYENAAPIDRLDLRAELAAWSGVRTAGQLAPGA